MSDKTIPVYQIDARWAIVSANDAFCRTFRCTESTLIGRDVRELLREDWRMDFRHYVARALVGVGDCDLTVPFVAPCGEQGWFKHRLEPLLEDGLLSGYRASVQRHEPVKAVETKAWWQGRPVAPRPVWDFDAEPLARAS